MSEKLVLIDGHSILNRAFFGIPDLTNSEGLHTNAVYGFLNILFKILPLMYHSQLFVIRCMQNTREPESRWRRNFANRCL